MARAPNLRVTEIKAFVPARDFGLSKRFYREIGFIMASEGGGVAYFRCGSSSLLLQDFWAGACAQNFFSFGACATFASPIRQGSFGAGSAAMGIKTRPSAAVDDDVRSSDP
jgi:hypothetical protein